MDIVRKTGIPATPESTIPAAAAAVPAQISGRGPRAQETWLAEHGIQDVREIRPVHIAAWLEVRMREASRPTIKQELAAIRRLFDWLTVR